MKKETIIAVTFGIVLGITVAVVMILSTQKKQDSKVIPVVQNNQITPIATKDAQIAPQLELSEPTSETVTDKETITIKGKTTKDSLIVVQSAVNSKAMTNEADTFEIDFPLALGENKITVSVYPKDANGAVYERELIIYSLKEE